jgi:hypothetical protein
LFFLPFFAGYLPFLAICLDLGSTFGTSFLFAFLGSSFFYSCSFPRTPFFTSIGCFLSFFPALGSSLLILFDFGDIFLMSAFLFDY